MGLGMSGHECVTTNETLLEELATAQKQSGTKSFRFVERSTKNHNKMKFSRLSFGINFSDGERCILVYKKEKLKERIWFDIDHVCSNVLKIHVRDILDIWDAKLYLFRDKTDDHIILADMKIIDPELRYTEAEVELQIKTNKYTKNEIA
eukprot:TRINITY_DN4217_c0_g1_i1.p1 TRINITY_DN4217_c0_g1~~TRINITY_DN4217_c0_g1_i1.p1  ORF type:complete len:149 (+),score=9.45 TRINITY_DN4217_c0_g1_i1:137-583(+)